jgi:hypothetical protein
MKKKVKEILSKYRKNEGYTMEHAERELLDLFSVSQQRELLKSFCEYIDLESHTHPDDVKIDIENHLKGFNCG